MGDMIFFIAALEEHTLKHVFFFFEQLWNSHITMYPGVGTTYPTHPPTMRMALVEDSSQTHDENLFVSMHNLVSLKRSLMGVFFFRFQLPN